MKVTYQSNIYSPEKVAKRYVRCDFDGDYHFCEVNAKRYDIRQGIVDEAELTTEVKDRAESRRGYIPSWVEWPA